MRLLPCAAPKETALEDFTALINVYTSVVHNPRKFLKFF